MVQGETAALKQVTWMEPSGRRRSYPIVQQIDAWSYVGRWWHEEIRREYQLVETDSGLWIELYCENGAWWVSRTNA